MAYSSLKHQWLLPVFREKSKCLIKVCETQGPNPALNHWKRETESQRETFTGML